MAPLPTKKLTRAFSRRKFTAYRLEAQHVSICSQCHGSKRPHRVCMHCGYYKGRQILKVGTAIEGE
ncbi:MAG: 50S ribosomal protein L32 [SAR202 cluster bacterium]|nr:50S ribosomal protein L32 [SAR202 cluster bacterium]